MNSPKVISFCLELLNSCYPLLINKHIKWYCSVKKNLLKTNIEIQEDVVQDISRTKNTLIHDIVFMLKFIVYGFEDPNLYITYPDDKLNIPYFPEILVQYKDKQLIVYYSTNKKIPKGTIIHKLNNIDPIKMLDNLIYMWGGQNKCEATRTLNAPRLMLHFNGQRIHKIKSIQANKGAGIKLYWKPCDNWQVLTQKAFAKPKKYKSKFTDDYGVVNFQLVDYHSDTKMLQKACSTLVHKIDGIINVNVSGNTQTSRQFVEQIIDIIYGKSYKFPSEYIYQTISQRVCEEWTTQIIQQIVDPIVADEQKNYLYHMKKKIQNNNVVVTQLTPKHRISNTSCFIGQLNIEDETMHHSQDLLKYYLGHDTSNDYISFNHLEFTLIEGVVISIPTAIQFFNPCECSQVFCRSL